MGERYFPTLNLAPDFQKKTGLELTNKKRVGRVHFIGIPLCHFNLCKEDEDGVYMIGGWQTTAKCPVIRFINNTFPLKAFDDSQ